MEKWSAILEKLESKVSRPNFVTWLKSTEAVENSAQELTIAVPNLYAKNWIEKNIFTDLEALIKESYPQTKTIKIVVRAVDKSLPELPLLQNLEAEEKKEAAKKPVTENPFNQKYTFDTFIVGNNNRLAFAASQVVAEKPGEVYNPLFLYGGVGLGKTHLMQAVGNEIWQRDPKKKIIYTSCEIFTSEFIQALQNKLINDFKKKYRSVDVLLIDDIQFLSNKEGTQEEFFHTFNILHQANRQIIVTSDRVPKEIPDLEERLSSRFGWGMIADIQPPNFENRVAILQAKAKEKNLTVSPAVLEFIANTITSNVRELEGSLITLAETAKVQGGVIDVPFAQQALKDLTGQARLKADLSSRQIITAVAKHLDLEPADILSQKRVREVVYARHLVMYLLKTLGRQSFPQIGDALGGKDHTTIMHGVTKVTRELKTNPAVEQDIQRIQQAFYRHD